MNARWTDVWLVPLIALGAAGCGHDIQSPKVSSKSVAPDLVCVEQLTTTVAISGSGFTPMPSQTLESKQELILPRVALIQKQAFGSAAASGTTVIPDDPKSPGTSLVHWTSEQAMSFNVTPALTLAPGLYDVKVTNPDGKQAANLAEGLTAVPRPTLTLTNPDILCDAESDQTVALTGTGLLQVGSTLPTVHVGSKDFTASALTDCETLPGTHTEGNVQSCKTASFVIPKGACTPGTFPVTLTNPAPANCVSTDPIELTFVPPPTVASITADLICDAQADQTLAVAGTGFLTLGSALEPTALVGDHAFVLSSINGCTAISGTFLEGAAQSCTAMTFAIPKGTVAPGDYPITVKNPAPADCVSLDVVTLHVAPPPVLSQVAPLAVCDAQNDQVVAITGTGFLEVGTTLPAVTIGTVTTQATQATGCTAVAGTFAEGVVQTCTGLTVAVHKGTFAKGIYPVSARNPDPAGCKTSEAVSLIVDDPPAVTGTQPLTLCEGGGNLNVNGSGFLASATVSLSTSGQTPIVANSSSVNAAGTQIAAGFGTVGVPGTTYDVVVDNGDGCSDPAPHQKVSVVTGPVAFFADPEVVFNGINTRVTVYVTTLTLPLPTDAVSITPAGQTSPVTTLTWNSVTGHPNRVQVVVPESQAAGSYDLHLNDATGCQTTLPKAITVTGTLNVSLKSVVVPFGYTGADTAVTILRDKTAAAPANVPFTATPRVFLNPTSGSNPVAIQVQSVSFVDGDTLTAVVPKNQPAGAYDLIVVNPDGTVGLLSGAFTEQTTPPPVVSAVTPSSIIGAAAQSVVVTGQYFSSSVTVSLSCQTSTGTATPAPNAVPGQVTCAGTNCSATATVDGSGLASGDVCVLRLVNADKSYFDYSAIGVTGPSLNISASHAGQTLNVGRRALATAAGNATTSARFVYAIGGDDGATTPTSLSSTEFASVDIFGNMGAWSLQPRSVLGTARSFAASAVVGRYIYLAGGFDGTNPLATAERAMILSPLEVPTLDIDDLVPVTSGGLDEGSWLYRVSANFTASDPDNPSGESLASDEFIAKVPSFVGHKINVVLAWTAPVNASGTPLPNIASYNVYRTKAVNGSSGGEVLLATVPSTTLTYTDDGSATPGTQKPLPVGSTGRWAALPSLNTVRKGAAGAYGFDPSNASKFYVYALLGLDGTSAPLGTYEYLPVTIDANGHQTVGTWTAGTTQVATKRWQVNAWVVDSTVTSKVTAPDSYIYVGAGATSATVGSSTLSSEANAAKITAGGALSAFTTLSGSGKDAGYGVCAANGQLFSFGGANASPSGSIVSSVLGSPQPALGNWNNEGVGMVTPRYLMGSTVQSAFIFLVGGASNTSPASTTTELVIW